MHHQTLTVVKLFNALVSPVLHIYRGDDFIQLICIVQNSSFNVYVEVLRVVDGVGEVETLRGGITVCEIDLVELLVEGIGEEQEITIGDV